MKRLALILAALLLVAAPPVSTQQSTDTDARIQARLGAWVAETGLPGATVGIVNADGTLHAYAAGVSDRETARKMQPNDLMLAGSTGKTFFAAVALHLIDSGKLELDAPISKYLGDRPWFSRLPNASAVTVRQLMTHTSGIVRYEFDDKFTNDLRANPDRTFTPEQELAYLFDTQAPFEAGKGWDYSDTNYIVLGMIVEKIANDVARSGTDVARSGPQLRGTYYDLIRNQALEPLKLEHVVPSTSRTIKGLVQGYAADNDPLGLGGPVIRNGQFVVNPQFEWAGGGFATSAPDLARWGHELYSPQGKAISGGSRKLMIDAAVPSKLGPGVQYGLGVIIRPPNPNAGMTSATWGHSGFFPGYLSELIYVVDTGVTLAIQVNSSAPRTRGSASPLRLLYEIANSR